MAATIKRIGKRREYPWSVWTDGRAWRARKGTDFKCSAAGFRSTLYTHASRHDLTVFVSVPDAKTVEFRFDTQA
jgi:hypothetical protein